MSNIANWVNGYPVTKQYFESLIRISEKNSSEPMFTFFVERFVHSETLESILTELVESQNIWEKSEKDAANLVMSLNLIKWVYEAAYPLPHELITKDKRLSAVRDIGKACSALNANFQLLGVDCMIGVFPLSDNNYVNSRLLDSLEEKNIILKGERDSLFARCFDEPNLDSVQEGENDAAVCHSVLITDLVEVLPRLVGKVTEDESVTSITKSKQAKVTYFIRKLVKIFNDEFDSCERHWIVNLVAKIACLAFPDVAITEARVSKSIERMNERVEKKVNNTEFNINQHWKPPSKR